MGLPSVPLTELYNAAGKYIRARGGTVLMRNPVDSFRCADSEVTLCSAGEHQTFDSALIAVPFEAMNRILPDAPEAATLRQSLQHFEASPITGIHLWFDRQISDLDHAVLLDRTIQWMFHKSRILARDYTGQGSYVELVVSASKSLVDKSRSEIIDLAVRELQEFFPAARDATVIKAAVIKEVYATYSPSPGIDSFRPANATAWPCVFVAGDWTATGWPATMEGAVRSGYLAAEALARSASSSSPNFLVPDLPSAGLMRLFRA
jgi:zeta-carotene desaturase